MSLSKVNTLSSSEYGFQYMTEKFLTSYLAYVIREGSDETVYLHAQSQSLPHTGQCKRTGGCYNELVVAFFSTGGGVKGKKIYTC